MTSFLNKKMAEEKEGGNGGKNKRRPEYHDSAMCFSIAYLQRRTKRRRRRRGNGVKLGFGRREKGKERRRVDLLQFVLHSSCSHLDGRTGGQSCACNPDLVSKPIVVVILHQNMCSHFVEAVVVHWLQIEAMAILLRCLAW